MKKLALFLTLITLSVSCEEEEDNINMITCSGDTCAGTIGDGETMATVPSSAFGVFETMYSFAEPNSPFSLGTSATFEVTTDQTLIVSIEGEDCITISNPVWRFGADVDSGNYTFQDECRDMLSYNVSFNMDGSFNEVNIEPAEGSGFFGQFSKK